ncbi:type II toxin-antitoxin system VapC family toxin [Dyadobacter fanqingshengii]|uniref:Type II toxin-antitoxin system VapC family toxin n=1 Tax=Dyadobacter fanqingshengii TaxID=2906443 RepID=A0A9X1PD17_9BACT|nr:type II toxin-antitoxin system VapC family toxin [Dyadobacter fanqingshengii]MCF0041924.1 type II toxin-antitoxin system VapC family toxin [Dyadobacter fanqingshengii]USJ36370.1 type II toxin-antitoxin system VapC family toxin [Dyadobacter fanqingshengii]
MKVLLDTHTVLWFINGDSQISVKAKRIIEDKGNEVLMSAISLFEISIKLKLTKIILRKPLAEVFDDIRSAGIAILPIHNKHLLEYQNLSLNVEHRDPFDRLIISTAISEQAAIVSVDKQFDHYQSLVEILW